MNKDEAGKAVGPVARPKLLPSDIRHIIRTKGLWATSRRMLLFATMYGEATPLPVEALFEKLKGQMNRVTVYRILQVFEEKGIVTRVNLRRDREYYELSAFGGGHHHHLVCNGCGVVEDVDVPEPKDFEMAILKQSKKFQKITSHSLEFFGKCRSCVKI